MVKCTFCGGQLPKGAGKMFVFVTGKINYFCNSKCEKNALNLHRKARNVKWTANFEKGKPIAAKENKEESK
ncbi:50S ribosomal protein L24e [Candidatus Woesearchaeota archaeon]|nr:50S ribosomal protein L24e [Candidatus Woesearchaeota archaeon]